MQTIVVSLAGGSYEIRIGRGLLQDLSSHLQDANLRGSYLIVSQPRILKAVSAALNSQLPVALIPDGERAKSLTTVRRLLDTMADHRLNRQSAVIALGGGVVGDIAGFAASLYMRGIAVVQVPTTLLAQVDSSIGGKTGVNHRTGKNLIGTFHQPRLVLADSGLLRSLPAREYACGLFEALKCGVIHDPLLFEEFETGIGPLLRRESDAVERLVERCAAIKAAIVMADEKESDVRRILNFGHTIGHGLETAANYRGILHGEAVGYGMIAAARIASRLKKISETDRVRIEDAVRSIGRLPRLTSIRVDTVLAALQHDKKVRDGSVFFILPVAIGRVEITSQAPMDIVTEVVKGILDEAR